MDLILSKMDDEEKRTFKNAIITKMKTDDDQSQHSFSNKYKTYNNTAINCTILSDNQSTNKIIQYMQQNQHIHQKVQQQKVQQQKAQQQKVQQVKTKVNPNQNQLHQQKNKIDMKQSSNFFQDEVVEEKVQYPKKKEQTRKKTPNRMIKSRPQKAYKYQQGEMKRNVGQIDKQQSSQILHKLDITVSEYSDMFQSDEQQKNTMICRVQVIMQIMGTNPQLQIYNLQLYMNSELRIMSMYNRQFERHKLISMKKIPSNYYELSLRGGKVDRRRVKFMGQAQPFMKYLNRKE